MFTTLTYTGGTRFSALFPTWLWAWLSGWTRRPILTARRAGTLRPGSSTGSS